MRQFGTITLCLALVACGASQPSPAVAPSAAPAPGPTPSQRGKPLAYDDRGDARECKPPLDACTDAPPSRVLLDRCKLAGFRPIRCGCETLCTGNAMAERPYYDAAGGKKRCIEIDDACTPPDTSAAFQDACTDAGHRLQVCGCEWLCSGKPK